MARAVRVCIRATAGAFPVQADGEAISAAAAAVDVEVCPGALRVLRPAL
jgi:diacylglycerol kinase family enzyme